MALTITSNYGILEIEGNIIGKNAIAVQQHLENIFSKSEQIILSIGKVKKIDASGVQMLTILHKKAMKLNKIFCIIGKENKKIKKAFGQNSYILRSDFL